MKVKLLDEDALIVVDMQNDFMSDGALPVKDADIIVENINKYIDLFSKTGTPVFFTRDWHPNKHISFKDYGGIWPKHCIANTKGAEFSKDLFIPRDNFFIVSKGTLEDFDAYSGFQATLLKELLYERGIKRIFVCGVASEYCVKNTLLGGINLGFVAFLLLDSIQGVNINKNDSQKAINTMLMRGAIGIQYEDLI